MKPESPSRRFAKPVVAAAAASLMLTGLAATAVPVLSPAAPANAQNVLTYAPATGFADLVEKVMPAVISIETQIAPVAADGGFGRSFGDVMPDLEGDHPLRRFFEEFSERGFGNRSPQSRPRQAQGSGFIISADGYAVTNHHVVRNASQVRVRGQDGEIYPAKVIGTDRKTDLALLKIDADKKFSFVEFAKTKPRVGDWVIAVGNPFGLGGTVTTGIVSASGRNIGSGPYDDFLQIDAPINRGNSGGPAFNLEGKVIGVNTAIFSPSGGSVGIGFAIPAALSEQVIEDLRDDGHVERGWLGVQIQPVSADIAESLELDENRGALVAAVTPSSPAKRAGLKQGDAILALDGERIEDPTDLALAVARAKPGKKVSIDIWRNGAARTLEVKIAKMPKEGRRARSGGDDEHKTGKTAKLGLRLAPVEDDGGALVTAVRPGSVAAESGIRTGDVIVEIGGTPIDDPDQAMRIINETASGGGGKILVLLRSGENQRFVALAVKTG